MSKAGYLLPETIAPVGVKCVTLQIPDDPNHIRAFWGHLFQLARWWSWERDDSHAATDAAQVWSEVWANARNAYDENNGDCSDIPYRELTPDQITEYIEQFILTGGDTDCCQPDIETEDNMLQIVHVDGVAYLQESCGCNPTNFYRLDGSPVSIDPATGEAKIDQHASKDYPVDPYAFVSTETTAPCLASSATAAIIASGASLYYDIANIFESGYDIVSAVGDELYNLIHAVTEMSTDQILPNFYGTTPALAATAISGSATFTALAPHYTYTGPLSRADIMDFVSNAPETVDGVYVRRILQDWSRIVILELLNGKIELMQASCEESGGVVPDGPTDIYSVYEYPAESGDYYPIWDVTLNQSTSLQGVENGIQCFPGFDDDWLDMKSVGAIVHCDDGAGVRVLTGANWRSQTYVGPSWHPDDVWVRRHHDTAGQEILKLLLTDGVQELVPQQNDVSGITSDNGPVIFHDTDGTVMTVKRVVAVGLLIEQ